MSRVTYSVASRKRRKKILKLANGYRGGRSKLYKTAKEAVEHALVYAYRGRKERKRDFRKLWITRISAGVHQYGITYSKFMNGMVKSDIKLNRKILADLVVRDADVFKAVMDKALSQN